MDEDAEPAIDAEFAVPELVKPVELEEFAESLDDPDTDRYELDDAELCKDEELLA